jgi:hypothetical protein
MMTTMQDVRATIPDFREVIPDLREAMPDFREVIPDLRRSMPDARAAIPALREGLADMRADLPAGPWGRERPSIVRRIAIVVVTGLALAALGWLVLALVERRRLAAQVQAIDEEEMAVTRAEDEGMGTAITEPSATRFEDQPSRSSKVDTTSVAPDTLRPMVGASSSPIDGGQADGR